LTVVIRLAWRSIWRKRWRTLITVGSIGLGLSVAIFFIALGEGIYAKLIGDVVRMQAGHLTLEHPGYRRAPAVDLFLRDVGGLRSRIKALPRVEQTKLIVLGQGVDVSGFAMNLKLHARVTPGVLLSTAGLVFVATLGLSLVAVRRLGRLAVVDELRAGG